MEVAKTFDRDGVRYRPGDTLPEGLDRQTLEHYKRHGMVREAMVRVGILSAGYKFKVLSLDSSGQRFVVMVDLTEEQREVLSLRFVGELPIRDVALSLGKTEGAVTQLQARAVAALGRLLSGEG